MTELKLIAKPEIVDTEARPIAKLYAKVPTSEIGQQMGKLVTELADELRAQNVRPAGPWFTHHFRRPDEFFDFEVCFPVAAPIKPNGRVQPGEWPAMKVVRTTYTGPYNGLVPAWMEFLKEIEQMGLQISPEIWEVYLKNPDNEPDSAKWTTELNRPLA